MDEADGGWNASGDEAKDTVAFRLLRKLLFDYDAVVAYFFSPLLQECA
jgi:hypothetical protein